MLDAKILTPKALHTDSTGIACEHVLKHNMEKSNVISLVVLLSL